MYIVLKRTDAKNTDFQNLIIMLDEHLTVVDEAAHTVCKPYNRLDSIEHVVVAYMDDVAIGCGALRKYKDKTVEIKRMFVSSVIRKKGIGSGILQELEQWAIELGFELAVLETGLMLPEAVRLYQNNHYRRIPNYGQYRDFDKSICFSKNLI